VLADLIATEGVVEEATLRGRVGVMALHGGLEAGTAPAARRCARLAGASLYAVEQPAGFRWHVPSTRFDPAESAKLERFLDHVRVAISFHGFGRRGLEHTVLLGGTNIELRHRLAAAIERATPLRPIADPESIPAGLSGAHPLNPVNIPEYGGVQIELSPQAREKPIVAALVDAVAAVLAAEQPGADAPQ
jgi:phage replication-related protein YjqB (UPF0714/DUF867 family)